MFPLCLTEEIASHTDTHTNTHTHTTDFAHFNPNTVRLYRSVSNPIGQDYIFSPVENLYSVHCVVQD